MTRDIAITFAGGGSRAFYQIGLMEQWWDLLRPRVGALAGCSAGSAMALMLMSGRIPEAKSFFEEQRRGVTGLVDWSLARQGRRPFPHDAIYRRTLRHALADGGFERIQGAPFPLFIVASKLPRFMPSVVGIGLGLGVYQAEKKLRKGMLHPTLPKRFGFSEHVRDARECEDIDALIELVIASSSTPPFTKRGRVDGRVLLDGSLIDNAPAYLAERASRGITRNVVLMTRPYPRAAIGERGARLYIAPRDPLPIARWDYSESAPIEETLEVGRRDGARHRDALLRFLEPTSSRGRSTT